MYGCSLNTESFKFVTLSSELTRHRALSYELSRIIYFKNNMTKRHGGRTELRTQKFV